MTIRDTVRSWLINLLDLDSLDMEARARAERLAEFRDYYEGAHKKQLRVKQGKMDDNITVNLCGLIVDKSVSALVGDPEDGRGQSERYPGG